MKFSIMDFFSKYNQIRNFPAGLVTFTEEIRNGKLHFLSSEMKYLNQKTQSGIWDPVRNL